jgi:carbamoyl-phosphate synthase large subunit
MRSTGEVMGVGPDFPSAFDKALLAAGDIIPTSGKVLVSLRTLDRARLVELGQRLTSHGFEIVATRTNQEILKQAGLECTMVNKVSEGSPHIVDAIKNDEISLIINSTDDSQGLEDASVIRCQALIHKIPCTTTVAAAFAMLDGLMSPNKLEVRSLQSIHK